MSGRDALFYARRKKNQATALLSVVLSVMMSQMRARHGRGLAARGEVVCCCAVTFAAVQAPGSKGL